MAIQTKIDELNNIESFFEPMEISTEEKKRRVDMAWELFDIFYAMFVRVGAMKKVNEVDSVIIADVSQAFGVRYKDVAEKYLGYLAEESNESVTTPQGHPESILKDVIEPYIDNIVTEIVETTVLHDEDYYSSSERAVIIAETETNTVGNIAADEFARATGKTVKTWVTMMDNKVRDEHMMIHGQTIPIDDYFMVGGFPARYPHDPDLPPEMVVNCRCVCEYS